MTIGKLELYIVLHNLLFQVFKIDIEWAAMEMVRSFDIMGPFLITSFPGTDTAVKCQPAARRPTMTEDVLPDVNKCQIEVSGKNRTIRADYFCHLYWHSFKLSNCSHFQLIHSLQEP